MTTIMTRDTIPNMANKFESAKIDPALEEEWAARIAARKSASEQNREKTWAEKIGELLRSRAAQEGVEEVEVIEGQDKKIIFKYGDKQVMINIMLTGISVGESGGGLAHLTISQADLDSNPWFREAFEQIPTELTVVN